MKTRFESSFQGYNRCELFFQAWMCKEAVGTMVVTHGLAEHSECYAEMAAQVNHAQWNMVAWDLRGHGRSEGKRGLVIDFKEYERDLNTLIETLQAEDDFKGKKFVLFGHSMGGLITIKTLIDRGLQSIDGLVLSSPALGLAVKVPALKEKASHLLHQWYPKITLFNELQYRDLTRDEDKIKSYEADTFRHDKISPGVYLGMVDGFKVAFENTDKFDLPMLMIVAGQDRIVSTPKAMEFFEELPAKNKKIEIFSDSLHEVFNDLDREEAYKFLKSYLKEVANAKPNH